MTPQDFIAKWGPGGPAFGLNEEQGAQSHFLDLCELLGVAKPGSEPGYLFEQGSRLAGQASGYAGRPAKTSTPRCASSKPTAWRWTTRRCWWCATA